MRPLVIALVVLAHLAAPAAGSTVAVSPLLGRPDDVLVYLAGPGEANRVVIDAEAGTDTFLVSDPGAAIAAGESCVPVDAHAARCVPRSGPDGRARPIVVARIDVGDGADEVRWTGEARLNGTKVLGGEGDDALAAPTSQFGSLVYGGRGDDRLAGAVFDDELYGEDGDDELLAGLGGHLYGGRGDDRLTGSRGDDDLDGGDGADVLRGLGGGDELLDSEKVAARDAPYELAEGDWESRRDEVARQFIDLIGAFAPGFEDILVHHEVLGPPHIEERVGLTGGNIFQGEVTPDQMWEHRLTPRTPVEGLYLCGAATHPAGSVIALNGRNAAEAVLADARRLSAA